VLHVVHGRRVGLLLFALVLPEHGVLGVRGGSPVGLRRASIGRRRGGAVVLVVVVARREPFAMLLLHEELHHEDLLLVDLEADVLGDVRD